MDTNDKYSGPADTPQAINADACEEAIAPHIQKAKATYAAVKERFLKGLPAGSSFFVTIRLRATSGHWEHAFIKVLGIEGTTIIGLMATHLQVVTGYPYGQRMMVEEHTIIDWLISSQDGSEEGNFVGKFLDTLK
ncbi:MAG: DUF2314 domain-containing protein [Lentisphaerae bacterium]|nr:DUF2314 domain-containing protein [Lentisphaerota bacterium]